MSHGITQADIDNLRTNERKPRIVREYRDAADLREALAQTHHVKTIAQFNDARRSLTQLIRDAFGDDAKRVKIPHASLVLMNGAGVQLTRWEAEQRNHVKAAIADKGIADFHLGISPDVQRGTLAAWEARR